MTLTQIKKLANNQINTDLTSEQAKELNMHPMTYVYFENEYIVVCKKDGSVIIYESNGIDEDIKYINNCLVSLGYINANENKMTNYIIFTNEYLSKSFRKCMNQNRFKSHYATTKEEAKTIIKEVKKNGYEVTKVTTALGNRITL